MSYTNNIGNLQQIVSSVAAGDAKEVQQANSAQANQALASTSARPDQASLSPAGSVLTQALSGNDVRAEKVAALQQAIGSGTYNVSSSDIADKLIYSMLK